MEKQINFAFDGKGGVDKSFFATNFIQYLKDQQLPRVAIDATDINGSHAYHFYPEATGRMFANANELRGPTVAKKRQKWV